LIWSTSLLVAGVSNSDFSWATLDSLADTVDVLLTNWAGDWMTWCNNGGSRLDSQFDAFGSNSLESCRAGDKRNHLLSSDALVSSRFELGRALGNTLSVSISEPSLWASKLSFVSGHGRRVFRSVLNFPSDSLPFVSGITSMYCGMVSRMMFGLVVGMVMVDLLARTESS